MKRRRFLTQLAAGAALAGLAGPSALGVEAPKKPKWRKAILYSMLPPDLADEEKFKLARRCGFEGIEAVPTNDLDAARRQADLARQAGVPIHSVIFGRQTKIALADPDPAVVDQGIRDTETALRQANASGADTILIVAGNVTDDISYAQAYERSQKNIRRLSPLAQEMKVILAVENVWNKFLLSPLEFARYIDEFDSPWVRAYFDMGNVILDGFTQDWIRTLGKRIVKLHIKDFKRKGYEWTNLLDGDVNWKESRKALLEVGYEGFITVELQSGNEAYLTDVARRMDRFIEGALM